MKISEYAVATGIAEEPAFAWWVPYTMKKRDRIIAAVNTRVTKWDQKFVIKIPHTLEEAKAFDK